MNAPIYFDVHNKNLCKTNLYIAFTEIYDKTVLNFAASCFLTSADAS